MSDKYASRFVAFSFYALALAIFISVSLISIYHLLTLITFIILFTRKEINLKSAPLSVWALLVFIGTQLLSAAINFSELQDKSRSIGAIKYPLVGILALFIFRNTKIQTDEFLKKHSKIAFNIFLITIIVAFFYGLTKIYTSLDLFASHREAMVEGKPNTRLGGFTDIMRYGYGTALVLLALLTTALNLKKLPMLNKKYLFFTIIIGFAGLFFSYTRGAMLGLLVGIPVVFYYFNKRLTVMLAIASVAIISLMIIVSLTGGSNSSRFLMKSNSDSNKMRMSQYLSAMHAIQDRPIFGLGPQQLKFHVAEIKEKHDLDFKDYSEHAHNVFLEIAANSGIVGLLAFLTWIALWIKELYLHSNPFAKQMFFPVILFVLIAGQFEMILMAQSSALFYFLYAISHLNIFKKEAT